MPAPSSSIIGTAAKLAACSEADRKLVTVRLALPGDSSKGGDLSFIDHLQKKFSHQLGFLPKCALESYINRGQVSIALENDEPAGYILGKPGYLRDPHFGIMYQAAVPYDAQRRLVGTTLVQHFIDHMAPGVRLVGGWVAQDIESNEFWCACGLEAIAARHGSRRKGRVHIFWVGRTARGAGEPLRFPRFTSGGLMREKREVYGIGPGSGEAYREIAIPAEGEVPSTEERASTRRSKLGTRNSVLGTRKPALADMQRAFRYGQSQHICVVINGVSRYLPVAPFDMPDFMDVARTAAPGIALAPETSQRGELWRPAA